jgi:hypothetical protein
MNCRRIRRSIPLLAGNDLSEQKARRLRAHLERCELCRNEFRRFTAALNKVKELADRETQPEWTNTEWRALMARTISARVEKRPFVSPVFWNRFLVPLVRGLVVAVPAVVIGLVLWNTVLKPKSSPVGPAPAYVRKPEPAPPILPPTLQNKNDEKEPTVRSQEKSIIVARAPKAERPAPHPHEPAAAAKEGSQDVVSVTLVSQDTGLKVVWFLDKNFEWKGEGK